jgi:hypothetical protein
MSKKEFIKDKSYITLNGSTVICLEPNQSPGTHLFKVVDKGHRGWGYEFPGYEEDEEFLVDDNGFYLESYGYPEGYRLNIASEDDALTEARAKMRRILVDISDLVNNERMFPYKPDESNGMGDSLSNLHKADDLIFEADALMEGEQLDMMEKAAQHKGRK